MRKEQVFISTIMDVSEDETTHAIIYGNRSSVMARLYGFGLELCEFCLSDNMDDATKVASRFRENVRSVNHRIFHAPYNELFPHAIDAQIVRVANNRYKAALEICERAHCEKMVVRGNFVSELYHPLWFIEKQALFWKRFLAQNDPNVVICLENVLETKPELLKNIVEEVADERLRICLDVGHANLSPVKPEQWLSECGGYISHFHLHNNDGPNAVGWECLADTHRALNTGTIAMETLLREAERLSPGTTYTIETSEAEKSVQWLLEKGFIENN